MGFFLRVALLVAISFVTATHAHAADTPRRIVSFNICADQLVVALADPAQIAGLSPYASDPTLSAVAEQARAFPRLAWHAESTIPLNPDLVLVGPRDRSVTQRLLTALGFRVVELEFVSTIVAAREQIRQVAALLGHPARGEELVARLDAARRRVAAAPRPKASSALLIERGGYAARQRVATAPRPKASSALLIERGGYAEGAASLAAGMIAQAGLAPPAGAPTGIGGFVSLERLIAIRPDLLVLHSAIEQPRDQGSVYLTHPALQALYPPARRIFLPGRYTLCGGPGLVAGLHHLADQLASLAAQ